MSKRFTKGFSLIELLIVIAIIALLAAILFPVFARAKDSGFKTVALSQCKQLGTALLQYVESADGKYAPSTNYGMPDSAKGKLWNNAIYSLVKDEKIFVAPNSQGAFPHTWTDRGQMSIGYSSATAIDVDQGCQEGQKETAGCLAFTTAASFDKSEMPSMTALLAFTLEGPTEDRYRGYEFSPYNGVDNPTDPKLSPPLVSDRDLVKELKDQPAELLKPIYARYMRTGSDDGQTPVIFADGHAQSFSAKQISGNAAKIVWRFR